MPSSPSRTSGIWAHAGVDLQALAGPHRRPRSRHHRQGGSTITQQYLKNVVFTPEVTLDRKITEAALAYASRRASPRRKSSSGTSTPSTSATAPTASDCRHPLFGKAAGRPRRWASRLSSPGSSARPGSPIPTATRKPPWTGAGSCSRRWSTSAGSSRRRPRGPTRSPWSFSLVARPELRGTRTSPRR